MGALLWLGLLGCPSWYGLERLDALPPDFPLLLEAELGEITTSAGGQVAVDLVFETEAEAREAWTRLAAQAEAKGFARAEEGRVGKRDRVVLSGPGGRVELGCCPTRADRAALVFVSWWRPDAGD